jgi:uncharacterized protein
VPFTSPPVAAAWRHQDARSGFETVFFEPREDGWRISGCTSAVEDGEPWYVEYAIDVDDTWTTRAARVDGRSSAGTRSTLLQCDGFGRGRVDGRDAPFLDGCLDVDLESSAMTNAFPVHRMGLDVGARSEAPAAYVRAVGLAVERLEQTYRRTAVQDSRQRYDYAASRFDFTGVLVYDQSGLVLDYPGIATRVH